MRLTCDINHMLGKHDCVALAAVRAAIWCRQVHDDEASVVYEEVLLVVDGQCVIASVPVDRISDRALGVAVEVDGMTLETNM